LAYYFAAQDDPVAKGIIPLAGASVAIHQTEDPLFMGVRVSLNVSFATKFKDSRRGKKNEKIKAWPEIVLRVRNIFNFYCCALAAAAPAASAFLIPQAGEDPPAAGLHQR
jgi:hypothetical protein